MIRSLKDRFVPARIRWSDEGDFDFDGLLRPALAFAHPQDVVDDPDLTRDEKRAILAFWASDASAVEAEPSLRKPRGGRTNLWDDIMDALKSLDEPSLPPERRRLARFKRQRARLAGASLRDWLGPPPRRPPP